MKNHSFYVLLNWVFTMVLIVEAVGLELHHGSRLCVMNNFIKIE